MLLMAAQILQRTFKPFFNQILWGVSVYLLYVFSNNVEYLGLSLCVFNFYWVYVCLSLYVFFNSVRYLG